MMRLSVALAVLGFAAAAWAGVPANVVLVSASAAGPDQDGRQWSTAYRTLQAGIDAAASSGGAREEVWVAAGTYEPTRSFHTTPEGVPVFGIEVPNGVRVLGGFAGTEAAAAERAWTTNRVIIQPTQEAKRRSGVTLRVLIGGVVDGVYVLGVGANQPPERGFNGVGVPGGRLINAVVDGTVRGAESTLVAGSDRAQLEGVAITGTSTLGGHAGLRLRGAELVRGGLVRGVGIGRSTAGLRVERSNGTITRVVEVVIDGNSGATAPVRLLDDQTVLLNCRITNNVNTSSNPVGTCAVVGVPGFTLQRNPARLVGCVIMGNRSPGAAATVRRAIVIGCTVADNDGIGVVDSSLRNTIVWGNGRGVDNGSLAAQVAWMEYLGSIDDRSSVQFSIVQGYVGPVVDPTSISGADPLLSADGSLGVGSAAIDSGSNGWARVGWSFVGFTDAALVLLDVTGRRRFAGGGPPPFGDTRFAPNIDIGAYEFGSVPSVGRFCYADLNGDGSVDALDLATWMELWNRAPDHPLLRPFSDPPGPFAEIMKAGCPR